MDGWMNLGRWIWVDGFGWIGRWIFNIVLRLRLRLEVRLDFR